MAKPAIENRMATNKLAGVVARPCLTATNVLPQRTLAKTNAATHQR